MKEQELLSQAISEIEKYKNALNNPRFVDGVNCAISIIQNLQQQEAKEQPKQEIVIPNYSDSKERNWEEDFKDENGNYQCKCCFCGEFFFGNKHRVVCKICATKPKQKWEIISYKDSDGDIWDADGNAARDGLATRSLNNLEIYSVRYNGEIYTVGDEVAYSGSYSLEKIREFQIQNDGKDCNVLIGMFWRGFEEISKLKSKQCEHQYSRSMNQPYPRHCLFCDEIEYVEPKHEIEEKPTFESQVKLILQEHNKVLNQFNIRCEELLRIVLHITTPDEETLICQLINTQLSDINKLTDKL